MKKSSNFHLTLGFLAIFLLVGCEPKTDPIEASTSQVAEEDEEKALFNEEILEEEPETEEDEAEEEAQATETEEGSASTEASNESEELSYKVGELQPYDQALFDAARADEKKVLLDFHAPWCPICRANEPIVKAELEESDVVAFVVDYDTSTELKKQYGVTYQATYILLDGTLEERKSGYLNEASFGGLIDA